MAKLTFIGTGEAFDPELPNTSVLYTGSKNILVDCGFSVPHAFWRITHDPNLLDAIYITHIHADHTFGLPALLLWMRIAGRTRPLRIFGGSGVGTWLSRLLALAYPGAYEPNKCFPIEPVPIRPRIGFVWDDLMIRVAKSDHPVRNLAVRFEESGRAACISGDGIPTDATRALFRGCAVLSHECYYLTKSKNGHAALDELLLLAQEVHVETLCLVHLSTEHKTALTSYALPHAAVGQNKELLKKYGRALGPRSSCRIGIEKPDSYREYGAGFFGTKAAKIRSHQGAQLFFHKLKVLVPRPATIVEV